MSSQQFTCQALNPTAESELTVGAAAPRVATLENKKIGLFSNGKHGADVVLEAVAGQLQTRFSGIEFVRYNLSFNVSEESIGEMAQCDAVVSSIGD